MTGNQLLDALPTETAAALLDAGKVVTLPPAALVQAAGEPAAHVYFPLDGVLAVQAAASGNAVGVAVVGREGAVGLPVGAGEALRLRAVSAGPARALRVEAVAVRAASRQPLSPLPGLAAAFTTALVTQLAQHVACAGLHPAALRAGHWLRLTAARTEAPLPLQTLAGLLAVEPGGLAPLLRGLQDTGAVTVVDGQVTVTSLDLLATGSCDCADALGAPPAPALSWEAAGAQLSERHGLWLRALAGGTPVAELAAQEGLPLRETYRELAGVYARLGVTTRSAAVLVAAQRGWLRGR